MTEKTIQLTFFVIFTTVFSVLLFFILKPYLGVIFIAGVFAVAFYGWYEKLTLKLGNQKKLASLVTTCLILFFIIVPVIVLSALLLKEAIGLYDSVAFGGVSQNFVSGADTLTQKFSAFFPSGVVDSQIDLDLYARNTLDWIIDHFDSIFIAVFGGILNFILMLVSLYYLFIYGDQIKRGLITWSPLPDKYDEEFIETLKSSLNAVLRGRILVSVAQGIFIGLGFAIFGIGSPVLWGFVGGVTSLVPVLGTSVITVPAVVYLFLSGNIIAGFGLLVWAAVAVGLIDNFISVIFLKGKIRIHPLIVLFSILGGVEFFGMIGFLVGPVVASAFIALMKIYPLIMFNKKSEQL